MKKTPDILTFDEWKKLWSPHEIENPDDDFDGTIKCPSCEGHGTIQLEHSFKNENAQWETIEYDVDCAYCEGECVIHVSDERVSESKLYEIYQYRIKEDMLNYKAYYNMIHPEGK
jgi:RecJ-like exonuclease